MFKPLRWLFRVSGVAPTNSTRDKYFVAVAVVLTLLSSYHVHSTYQHEDRNYLFSKAILINIHTFYSNAVIFIVKSYLNRESFSSVRYKAYRPANRFEVCMILAFAVSYPMRLLSFLRDSGNLVPGLSRIFATGVTYIIVMQHMLLVRGLSLQFRSLNERIKSFISQTRANPLANFTVPLRSTIEEHWDLQDLVAKINSHYSVFYLIYMVVKLVYIIDLIYWVLMDISRGTGYTGFSNLLAIFLTAVSVIAPASFCQYCSNQGQASVLLAHQLWNVDGSTDMMNEVKFFSLAMRKRPVKFSVGGVFTLDCRFLTKFSVTALTYLIIAVQLSGGTSARGASVPTIPQNVTSME